MSEVLLSLSRASRGQSFQATQRQQSHPLSPLHEPLHGELNAIRKQKMLSLQSFLRKGMPLGYVGRIES